MALRQCQRPKIKDNVASTALSLRCSWSLHNRMEQQPPQCSRIHGWRRVASLWVVLISACSAALSGLGTAQALGSTDCSATITQASDGSFMSEIVCTGDSEPNVTMWNRAWLDDGPTVMNHTATFSWNGEAPIGS